MRQQGDAGTIPDYCRMRSVSIGGHNEEEPCRVLPFLIVINSVFKSRDNS